MSVAATRKNPDSRARLSQDGKGHSPHPSGSDQGYPGLPTALRPEDWIVVSGFGTKLVKEGDSLKDPGDLRSETEEGGPPDRSRRSNRNARLWDELGNSSPACCSESIDYFLLPCAQRLEKLRCGH